MNGGYRVEVLPRVIRQLHNIEPTEYGRLRQAMLGLGRAPRPVGVKKLSGRDGYRIRIGRYRIVYEIADQARLVTVLDVGLRKDIYRN